MMNKFASSLLGAIAATIVLSIIMFLKMHMGYLPRFNVIADLTDIAGVETPIIGWCIHILLGIIVWGSLFALISCWFKGPYFIKGLQFGVLLWLLMMIIYMPITENGLFASKLGYSVMITSLVFHLIYGFFLGLFTGFVREQ